MRVPEFAVDEPRWNQSGEAPTGERRLAVAEELRVLLPADVVLSRDEELRPYECDGLAAFRQQPMAVVLPRTEQQVRTLLLTCRRLGVPVVARGAGTGLSGGAMPHASGVVLSLARFNRILEIDPGARTARVQPGRAQSRDLGGGRAVRPVLRAGPVLADRLHASAATSPRTRAACIASSTA